MKPLCIPRLMGRAARHYPALVCALLLASLAASTPHKAPAQQQPTATQAEKLDSLFSDHELIRMEPNAIHTQAQESGEITLILKSGSFRFNLTPRDLRSPRYRAEATGPDGVRRQLPPPEVTTYKGTAFQDGRAVRGRFTITRDRFEGIVFTPGDWHYIEPLKNYSPDANPHHWLIYRQSDIRPGQAWRCGLPRTLTKSTTNLAIRTAAADTTTTYKVELATEADYEFVQYWEGSSETANAEILNILNQVEGVYHDELRLNLEVVFQHSWAGPDDPYTTTDNLTLLDQFRDHWNANFASEGYDLAHLWTGREEVTSEDEDGETHAVAGSAWTGEVCRRHIPSYSYGFSVGRPPDSQLATHFATRTAAHEIGHNFGASHPDTQDSPDASCAGTIMQTRSSTDKQLTFCQLSIDEIRSHVTTYNGCLEAEAVPLTLDTPTNLSATALGPHRIRLTWSDTNGDNGNGFRIDRRSSENRWWPVAWVHRTPQEFIDGNVEPEGTYTYRTYAYGDEGRSAWSRTATATTLPLNPGGSGPNLTKWVIPTMANSPGKGGAYYRTNVTLSNLTSPLDLTVRLYGPDGFVEQRTLSIKRNIYNWWPNFLDDFFGYRGTGAVEFSGNAPFTVSAEVYTRSPEGTYTTVVHNGPDPPMPYSSKAWSIGVVTVNNSTRTNAGVFNDSDQSQTVIATIVYPSTDEEQRLTFSLPPKGWAQKTITAKGERGYILWTIPQQAYLWVVSVDNASNDGTLSFPTPSNR